MKEVFENYLKDVCYKDWDIHVLMDNDRAYLQLGFWACDSTQMGRGPKEYQKSRKWMLSPYMTKSEVVQTAFKAILTAEEHEVRENFTYRNKPIFGPHFSIDALFSVCKMEALDLRMEKTG